MKNSRTFLIISLAFLLISSTILIVFIKSNKPDDPKNQGFLKGTNNGNYEASPNVIAPLPLQNDKPGPNAVDAGKIEETLPNEDTKKADQPEDVISQPESEQLEPPKIAKSEDQTTDLLDKIEIALINALKRQK